MQSPITIAYVTPELGSLYNFTTLEVDSPLSSKLMKPTTNAKIMAIHLPECRLSVSTVTTHRKKENK